jgi:hypothetical protein
VRLGVVLPSDADAAQPLAVLSDRAGVDVVWAPDETVAALVGGVVNRAVVAVLDGDTRSSTTLSVSIGRTAAEAEARAALDPRFQRDGAVVGRLEDGQARVIALAHDGVTDLRCRLPAVPDVGDLVAQLTAMVVGSAATHRPDAPRSADPSPPPWAAPKRD